jgi:hypothetical protein
MMAAANNPARLKLALAIEGVATGGSLRAGETVELVIGDDTWARARE